jgi:hypothetical protein
MLLFRGVDKYCSRWLVLGSSRGILRSCKGYGSRLRRIVDVSFAPGAYIMGVSQDVIIDTDVVKAGVAKRRAWRTASRRASTILMRLTIKYDSLRFVRPETTVSIG